MSDSAPLATTGRYCVVLSHGMGGAYGPMTQTEAERLVAHAREAGFDGPTAITLLHWLPDSLRDSWQEPRP